ncbi:9948_t:CDS:10, partial [Acaulospora morrowiae]
PLSRNRTMSNEFQKYFTRSSIDWNIIDFLEECSEEQFQKKIDKYLRSLDTIVAREQGRRKEKARTARLIQHWSHWGTNDPLGCLCLKPWEPRSDYDLARSWEKNKSDKTINSHSIVIQNSILTEGCCGNNFNWSNSASKQIQKRDQEEDDDFKEGASKKARQDKNDVFNDDGEEDKDIIISEDEYDLLTQTPHDTTVDCKLIISNICIRSKIEEWRKKSKYVEELHKQDLMRYNILDTTKSSATEARKLLKEHWDNIIERIEEFLSFRSYIPNYAFTSSQDTEQDGRAEDVKQYLKNLTKNASTVNKLCNTIKTEREKLRANGNTRWKKQVLQLMKIFQKQFLNGRNRLKEDQTEGDYIIKFISHIYTILFEDKSFLECSWGESTLRYSTFLFNRSLRDDDRRCSGNKIDAILSMVDMDFLEFSTLEVSGPPSCLDHSHYVGDKNKTAKMLKIILNYIKIKYPGDFEVFRRIKVYGIQIYDHNFYIYSMCMPFAGIYYFKLEKKFSYPTITQLISTKLPRFASNLWIMRDMIISSAKSILIYIDNSTSESSEEDSKIDE